MLEARKYLSLVHDRGCRGLKLKRVYRGLRRPDLFILAYMNLYANEGAMTPGTDGETADGMSQRKIDKIIKQLGNGTFEWKPSRRVYIPKANGKLRPIGMPNWQDKLIQEAMRLILDAYYEPQFSELSHGFRTNRGCHTALAEVLGTWKGTKWFIEVDYRGCFDNINHAILMDIIARDIQDRRFLKLLKGMLKAGYLEDWKYHQTHSGTPQGGLCKALHNPPYAKKAIMQSNGPKHSQIRCFKTIYFA